MHARAISDAGYLWLDLVFVPAVVNDFDARGGGRSSAVVGDVDGCYPLA